MESNSDSELGSLIFLASHRILSHAFKIIHQHPRTIYVEETRSYILDTSLQAFPMNILRMHPAVQWVDVSAMRELLGALLRAYGFENDAKWLDLPGSKQYTLDHLNAAVESLQCSAQSLQGSDRLGMERLAGEYRLLAHFFKKLLVFEGHVGPTATLAEAIARFTDLLLRSPDAARWKARLEIVMNGGEWEQGVDDTEAIEELKARVRRLERACEM